MKTITALALVLLCGCSGEFSPTPRQLKSANDQVDLVKLRRSLESISAWHRKNNTGLEPSLRPGLSRSELAPELLFGKCTLSEELKTLWSWHDGERAEVPFIWYHDFLPFEDAKSEYRWLLLNPLVRWDPRFIPILSFEGEWYGAYCGSMSGDAGPIVHFNLEDGARVTATNLTTFMATMAEALESGAVEWTRDGMVESIRKIMEIHRRHNPGLEFPYYVPDGA
jgi:cell wall assembly regulator SMI1